MTTRPVEPIPRVADVTCVRGADAPSEGAPDVLVEVPHGATRAEHFLSLKAELRGPFPADLQDFFFVNTDVGAPEVALRLAERVVQDDPSRSVLVIRCLVPRTFIDCNRVIDADAAPSASAAGEMTPGIVEYVRDPGDLALLLERYGAYRDLVTRACEAVCGAGGLAIMLHSFAPRNIDVPVDERIVERLRDAYRPDVIDTWPLRPEVDLLAEDTQGVRRAPEPLVAAVQDALDRAGIEHAVSRTYALHPSTLAWTFATRWPRNTLCLEIRRDLLAKAFTPFEEMEIDPAKADRLAGVLAEGLRAGWWEKRSGSA